MSASGNICSAGEHLKGDSSGTKGVPLSGGWTSELSDGVPRSSIDGGVSTASSTLELAGTGKMVGDSMAISGKIRPRQLRCVFDF